MKESQLIYFANIFGTFNVLGVYLALDKLRAHARIR